VRLLSRSPLPAISLAVSLSVFQAPAALADDLGDQLLSATRKSDVAQVKSLLDKGADVNAKTRYNQTPLFFACDRGNVEIAKLLIEHGAEVSIKDNFYGATPLTWAMNKKNPEMIALLISSGVDPSDALRDSIESDNKDLLKLVLDKGKTTPEMLSDTLLLAETRKKPDLAEMLKAKGVKVVAYPVDVATLGDYAGSYTDGGNGNITLVAKDGQLMFTQGTNSFPMHPVDKDKFRLVEDALTFTFTRENGKVSGFKFPSRGGDSVYKKKEASPK
jgi:hypothetical protein